MQCLPKNQPFWRLMIMSDRWKLKVANSHEFVWQQYFLFHHQTINIKSKFSEQTRLLHESFNVFIGVGKVVGKNRTENTTKLSLMMESIVSKIIVQTHGKGEFIAKKGVGFALLHRFCFWGHAMSRNYDRNLGLSIYNVPALNCPLFKFLYVYYAVLFD